MTDGYKGEIGNTLIVTSCAVIQWSNIGEMDWD